MRDNWKVGRGNLVLEYLALALNCDSVTLLTGEPSSPSLRYNIAMLESFLEPLVVKQLSATFKEAPGTQTPPGSASLLVSKKHRGCWWNTRLWVFQTRGKYFWKNRKSNFNTMVSHSRGLRPYFGISAKPTYTRIDEMLRRIWDWLSSASFIRAPPAIIRWQVEGLCQDTCKHKSW